MTNSETAPLLNTSSEFTITTDELYDLIDPKNIKKLADMGGTDALYKKLLSSNKGLSKKETSCDLASNKLNNRQLYFGVNKLDSQKQRSLLSLIWDAYQDKTLILLSLASLVSLCVGIYEDSKKPPNDPEPRVGWVEGVAIICAVLAVVLTNSINDYQKEKQFMKLNSKKENREIKLLRDGKECEVGVYEVCVGDIVLLENGDIVPVDGVCVKATNLVMDESSATGESDPMKKLSYEELSKSDDDKIDPFILSGSKVQEGTGHMIAINVGKNSYNGKTMLAMRESDGDNDSTPLQKKLESLAENIAKMGIAAAILMLMVLITKFSIVSAMNDDNLSISNIFEVILRICIQAITIIVVAVPEGLPMAVTLALAYATTQMIKDNNLVRVLSSCETMGNATVVCTDKTGTLTQNKMTVVQGVIAQKSIEGAKSTEEYFKNLSNKAKELLVENIASNSTAFESKNEQDNINKGPCFTGSKTECALLGFIAKSSLDYKQKRDMEKLKEYPFASKIKSMTTVVKVDDDNARIHTKGASEIILQGCTKYINNDGNVLDINEEMRYTFEQTINRFASESLRTIGLAYKDTKCSEVSQLPEDPPIEELVLIGILGIEDPLREGVEKSVKIFRNAGIDIKMITGDNPVTAKAIAKKAGIWTKGGQVLTGAEFRKLTDEERLKIIPRMQVLARSSPTDKQVVVKALQKLDEIVAMTGDGTNDGPALKLADVGFSMGITGTEVAKEASAIILMDDNFNSIVSATKWGRAVNDSVRKFLQFQLTVNITAVVIAFISAVFNENNESVLTTVQLLWVNLIMDTLAALALATEPPTDSLLKKYPTPRHASLITSRMWKHIFGQAMFQIVVNLLFIYIGPKIIKSNNEYVVRTCVFNVFVFLQVFNQFNCRRINDEINVLSDLLRDRFFIYVQIVIIVGQIIIVEFGGYAFSTTPLSVKNWMVTLCIGMLSLPIGLILRLMPTLMSDDAEQTKKPIVSRSRLMFEAGAKEVRTQLSVFNALRRKPRKSTMK